jgi:hypothetical protein
MLKEIIKFIAYLLLGVVILAAVTALMEWGMERQESYECQKWVLEASQYQEKGYFIAEWQKEQCQARGIPIDNVPVVK